MVNSTADNILVIFLPESQRPQVRRDKNSAAEEWV